jgi:hypothetical protein
MGCSEYGLFVNDGSCSEPFLKPSFKRVEVFAYHFSDAVVWMASCICDLLSVIIIVSEHFRMAFIEYNFPFLLIRAIFDLKLSIN